MYISIQTYCNGEWGVTDFETRDLFKEFIEGLFKEPGMYEFDDVSYLFKEQAYEFNEKGSYCQYPSKSLLSNKYWDKEKDKCRNGVIYISGDKTWYLTRDYYMWLNFLPISNKEIGGAYSFADVRDAQYHMALYELLAELNYLHVAILKKRQIASSYFHAAKLINQLWFEEAVTLKIGASSKSYIDETGTWSFFDEYASFLNNNTEWSRPMNPDKVLSWQQKIEIKKNGRKTDVGLKGKLMGFTFEKSATKGVGGPVKYFFHEEAGIAPKMSETFGYIKPALKSGLVTTGMFIAAGSVGDLSQCEPLKNMITKPLANSIYAVKTNLIDNNFTVGLSGLFIPEQWSMPPCIDKYGNSLVEEALIQLDKYFKKLKSDGMDLNDYQLELSQHPRTIEEAFAWREDSVFDSNLIREQEKRIENNEYSLEYVELYRDKENNIKSKPSNKTPIKEFPVSKTSENKEGVVVISEHPRKNAKFGTYYASIDPVAVGKTSTSVSLCSIYVYQVPTEVERQSDDVVERFIEGDKIVAWWTGRCDELSDTHQMLDNIIDYYQAWTLIENNYSNYVTHCINKRRQRYLVLKNQMVFLKDLAPGRYGHEDYGWRNVGVVFTQSILPKYVEYIENITYIERDEDDKVIEEHHGIEKIPDIMVMKEMRAYRKGLNVDRLISICSLIAFANIQNSNRGLMSRREKTENDLEKNKDLYKLNVSAFRNIGGKKASSMYKQKSGFKNLR